MGELKPCPFCGAEVAKRQTTIEHPRRNLAGLVSEPPCPMSGAIVSIPMWNRRAPSPVVAEVVKRLRDRAQAIRLLWDHPDSDLRAWIKQEGEGMDSMADRLERGE